MGIKIKLDTKCCISFDILQKKYPKNKNYLEILIKSIDIKGNFVYNMYAKCEVIGLTASMGIFINVTVATRKIFH